MGQYRQWLHYREMDHRLRARLEEIVQQARRLEAEIHLLADGSSSSTDENIILRALAGYFSAPAKEHAPLESAPAEQPLPISPAAPEPGNGAALPPAEPVPDMMAPAQPASWTASALFAQSYLTSFDAFDPATFKSLSPYAETGLLPEDLALFFAGLTPDGANGLPQDATAASSQGAIPIDKQSLRTDRLIQRWFERWGRSTDEHEQQQEDEGL